MKKISFMAVMMIAMLCSSVIAQQKEDFVQVVYKVNGVNDTLNILKTDFIGIHTVSLVVNPTVDTVQLLDSLKRCLMSGPWYFSKMEKRPTGTTTWTEFPIPSGYNTDYDLYSSDSTWSYHSGSLYYRQSYSLSKDGKNLIQPDGTDPILILTKSELQLNMLNATWQYRYTYCHNISSK